MTISLDDPERLAALGRTRLMDADAGEALDRLTRLASGLLKAPVALVSLVDDERQYFVSEVGLEGLRQTPLTHSFCQHVVVDESPLVVYDARVDPRVQDNLAIRDLGVIGYAGVPLITEDGHVLGSFCAIDTSPREWSENDLSLLGDLAQSVMSEISLQTTNRELRSREAQLSAIVDQIPAAITVRGIDGRVQQVNLHAAAAIGLTADEIVGLTVDELCSPEVAEALAQSEESLRSGVSVTVEMGCTHADGTEHTYAVIQYPIRDTDGAITGFGLLGMDVVDRGCADQGSTMMSRPPPTHPVPATPDP